MNETLIQPETAFDIVRGFQRAVINWEILTENTLDYYVAQSNTYLYLGLYPLFRDYRRLNNTTKGFISNLTNRDLNRLVKTLREATELITEKQLEPIAAIKKAAISLNYYNVN